MHGPLRPNNYFGYITWFAARFLWLTGCLSLFFSCECFVCGSTWKHSARLAGNERAPWFIPDAPQPPSSRPSPQAFVSGPPWWGPAEGTLCDVGCKIKASASLIPSPPKSLSFTALAKIEGCRRVRFLSAHKRSSCCFPLPGCGKTVNGRSWCSLKSVCFSSPVSIQWLEWT